MPALQWLYLPFRKSDGADMGFEHLSSLADLWVETVCYYATLEGFVQKSIALHPNRQLHLSRRHEEMIITNEERAKAEEECEDESGM